MSGNIQDFEGDELIKPRDHKVISTESTNQVEEQNVVEYTHQC